MMSLLRADAAWCVLGLTVHWECLCRWEKQLYRVCLVLLLYRSHDLQDRNKLNNLNSRCANININNAQYIKPIHIFQKKSIGVFFLISRPNTVKSFGKNKTINQIKLNILHVNHYHLYGSQFGAPSYTHYMHACKCVTLSVPVSSSCPYTN